MQSVLNLYKPVGITPLQLIEKFKEENPKYKNEKLGYAGRLDPMAEGILLVLVGEENKKRKEYEKLTKEYEFDVLFGIKTDSYDALGKISEDSDNSENQIKSENQKNQYIRKSSEASDILVHRHTGSLSVLSLLEKALPSFIGKKMQEYPPFSSPRVNGRPLFWWARNGRLSEIKIPKKQIEIYDLKIIKTYELTSKKLQKIIKDKISKIKGAFRQEEIVKRWEEFFEIPKPPKGISQFMAAQVRNDNYYIIKFFISCSSGTYVRSIANEMGGIALNIKRVKVGKYIVEDSIRI